MLITVNRFLSNHDTTLSLVSVDGRVICFGLEDESRTEKVMGETRIPAGTYKVRLRTVGGFHSRYKERFADIHKGMLHVQNVPGFEYILIHCGNSDDDTEGCLLVGGGVLFRTMMLSESGNAYRYLYPLVVDAAVGDDLDIVYVDNDIV